MATERAGGKLYEQFAPPERLTLLLEALARGDEPEAMRLRDSCPRRQYTQADAAYEDRVRISFEIMTVVCIDLRSIWAKLHVLEWALEAARNLATWQQVNATMAFLDGVRHGRRLPQTAFFAEPAAYAAGENAEDDEDDSAAEPGGTSGGNDDDAGGQRLSRGFRGEFARRMAAVEDRTKYATDCVLPPLAAAAGELAQELVNLWAAFGRFCRTRLGVGPDVVMRAWQMPLLAEIQEMLANYPDVRPQDEKVAEYAHYCCLTWDRRFGGPEDDHAG